MVKQIFPQTIAELNKTVSYPVQFISLQVESDTTIAAKRVNDSNYDSSLRLTTYFKDLINPSNGLNYISAANVISMSPVEETADIKTNALNIQLSGIPNIIIGVLESVNGIGGIVTIDQGLILENGAIADNTLYRKWQGIIQSISTDEENATEGNINITVECKSRIGALLNTKGGRNTSDSSFKVHNPTDRSMEFVASMVDFNPRFGAEE